MNRIIHRGKLRKWDDDRGFGFIKPNDNTRTVFIHISALKGMPRRPVVGDTITYEIVEETNGKIRAVHASIEGIAIQNQQRTSQRHSHKSGYDIAIRIGYYILILLVVGSVFIFIQSNGPSTSPPILTAIRKPGCIIKGNISISSGNKIYHLPGMEDYDSTVIDPGKGEQWFCTEDEAMSQGWKKAPR